MKKKIWIIAGCIGLAIAIALTIVLVVINKNEQEKQPTPPADPKTYVINIKTSSYNEDGELQLNEKTYGDYSLSTKSNIVYEGDDISVSFNPVNDSIKNKFGCVVSVKLDGVELCDYLNNKDINIRDSFVVDLKNITSNHTLDVVFDRAILDLAFVDVDFEYIGKDAGAKDSFGEISFWGAGNCAPQNCAAKFCFDIENSYTLSGLKLADLNQDDVSDLDKNLVVPGNQIDFVSGSNTINFNCDDFSFVLNSFKNDLIAFATKKIVFVVVPDQINLFVFEYKNDELVSLINKQEELYNVYNVSDYYYDYKFYYVDVSSAITTSGDLDLNVIKNNYSNTKAFNELVKTDDGYTKSIKITLNPNLCIVGSRVICIVVVAP